MKSTMTDFTTTQDGHSSIVAELKGQSVVIPDLNAILDGWPRQVSQDIDRLRGDVNEWLTRYCTFVLISKFGQVVIYMMILYNVSTLSHSSKLKALKAIDMGHFGATWFPHASSYERLKICTFLATWVSASFSSMIDHLAK